MKLQITKLQITVGVIAAAVILAVFSACASEVIDTSTPEAKLLSLRIGDVVMQGTRIPTPIINRDWDDDEYPLFGEAFNTIAFKSEDDIENARLEPRVSSGAKVKYGIANRTVRPNFFYDTRVPATFDRGDFIYLQVTSQDGEITNYYRFSTYISSPVKELTSIAVAGREGEILGPGDEWNSDALVYGTLHITQSQAVSAVIDAVPWAETSTIRYAKTTNASAAPAFGNNNTFAFDDRNFLYVEVMAENTEKNIYGFMIYVGRIATIKTLTFKGKDQSNTDMDFEALGKGSAKDAWSDNTGAGSFDSPHQPTEGFTFGVELDEANGRWEYAKITALPANNTQPTWTRPANNDAAPTVHFGHDEYLAIKIIPPNRAAGETRADHFYKVKIGLLAFEYIEQPKSHAYEVNDIAEPLKFRADRTLPQGTTYQWYEANSWYGGYGFDSAGRIGGKGEIIADPDFGKNDRGILKANDDVEYFDTDAALNASATEGIRFNVAAWHQSGLDEKTNVSLHNGGNQYYNLPTPGRPIPGATGDTYTPKTDYEPFLAGFSSETHYYWVEVTVPTDNGALKAVSKRAFIVTEWGQEWNLGHPQTDVDTGDPLLVDKDHYIIDLYAYQTGGYGLQGPPKNTRPFNKGNHGDRYLIPVTFPTDFNIMEYSVFTAQALFFLADGREWIQNWTQGDIGFARDARDEDGNLIPNAEPEEIVLWYNLTNDNATRGLASSGNEPQGSGLSVTPEYIVVKPAGTKPMNRMPPFSTDKDSVGRFKPLNNNDAQGWFTPYIELCEIRFEGPTRIKNCGCDGKEEDCDCEDCDCTVCEKEE